MYDTLGWIWWTLPTVEINLSIQRFWTTDLLSPYILDWDRYLTIAVCMTFLPKTEIHPEILDSKLLLISVLRRQASWRCWVWLTQQMQCWYSQVVLCIERCVFHRQLPLFCKQFKRSLRFTAKSSKWRLVVSFHSTLTSCVLLYCAVSLVKLYLNVWVKWASAFHSAREASGMMRACTNFL